MKSIVNMGVVGSGFGRYGLAPAFSRDSRCRVQGFAAANIDSARRSAEECSAPLACHWRELIDHNEIDAIAIAVPPASQTEVILYALAAGKPVFAEKPLASTLADAEKICEAARRANLPNMIDFMFPELVTWRTAKKAIEAGEIGDVRHFFIDWRLESHDTALKRETWKTSHGQGGGVLSHFGCHMLHAVEHMLGSIKNIKAYLSTAPDLTAGGDTLATIFLELEGGVTGVLGLSTAAFAGSGHRFEIYGAGGSLLLDNPSMDPVKNFVLTLQKRGTEQPMVLNESNEGKFLSGQDSRTSPVSCLATRFLDWVIDDRPAHPDFTDGLRVQQLINQVMEGK